VVSFDVGDNEPQEPGTDHHGHRRLYDYHYSYRHSSKFKRASLALKNFSPH
jgi:hypothetical protein